MLGTVANARGVEAANDSSPTALPERVITDAERDHWAYLPIRAEQPPTVEDERWSRHPVDRFIKAALDEQSVQPLPPAGRATLLRRVCFDLTGLPPTPEEVTEFLADDNPDAYERLVDRKLESRATANDTRSTGSIWPASPRPTGSSTIWFGPMPGVIAIG